MAEDPSAGASGEEEQLDEEQLRARLEEELRRVRIEDVIAQSVASILNLAARRIVKEDEQDLEQGRVGIDAARALVGVLPEELQDAIRPALSELQMLYARQAGGGEAAAEDRPEGEAPQEGAQTRPRQGPGKLWTPPGA